MKKIILVVLIAFLGFSCVKQEDIVFHGIDKVSLVSDSSANLMLDLENKSSIKLTLSELNIEMKLNNKDFLKLVLKDKITIKRKKREQISADFGYKFYNPMIFISLVTGKTNYSKLLKDMAVTGRVKVKAGIISKTFEFENIGINQLLESLGIDINEFIKSLKR